MQALNRYVGGRQEVGHIDLLDTISYFEVPEKDARKVMTQLSGIRYKGRVVRCNSEEEGSKPRRPEKVKEKEKPRKPQRSPRPAKEHGDWRKLMGKVELKGEEPDFSEEGWARRKQKKK